MNQKFEGEVGQVAGRDVKANSAQANVNIHVNSGMDPNAEGLRYISERQRAAIARRVFLLQEKTGVERLIVYRRLMTVFSFQSMDEMPHDLYKGVTRYLDTWIRDGTTERTRSTPTQREAKTQGDARQPNVSVPMDCPPSDAATSTVVQPASPSALSPEKGAFSIEKLSMVIGAITAGAVLYIATSGQLGIAAQAETPKPPPHCEYDGSRYSVGSVVRQDGIRQRCEETAEHAGRWNSLALR
ncbi:alpha/beta hydrolase [Trinickia sp. LjRoot230]|uniref:alpha/beta hydrolase n=1 Tax=Trinickia sp. LjRoot230 TaxID=3342288 RepID=UPI003ECE3B47